MPKEAAIQLFGIPVQVFQSPSAKSDFNGYIRPMNNNVKLKEFASGLKIGGVGEVVWTIMDSSGLLRSLKLPALYVPTIRVRLLSILSLLQQSK